MAELVIGIGMSHSPMVVAREARHWRRFGDVDRTSSFLRDTDGNPVTFAELEARANGRYAAQAELDRLDAQVAEVEQALERLRSDVAAAAPDLFVVLGDDQNELHDRDNTPALGVFYGDDVAMAARGRFGRYHEELADIRPVVAAGYAMGSGQVFPGHQDFARHLIATLIDRGFDPAAMESVGHAASDGWGVGHAFGVVETQLVGEPVPMVPLLLNTYFPPNQVPAARCYELGRVLRAAIDAYPDALRVALVASGGLSHFVTDEALDHRVLDALRTGDHDALHAIPEKLLHAGSSEIRAWFALAAACADRPVAWDEYVPVYRTPAGTGVGLGFLRY